MERMAAVLAAVCHDLDHPGVNQPFLIATANHLATLYKVRGLYDKPGVNQPFLMLDSHCQPPGTWQCCTVHAHYKVGTCDWRWTLSEPSHRIVQLFCNVCH